MNDLIVFRYIDDILDHLESVGFSVVEHSAKDIGDDEILFTVDMSFSDKFNNIYCYEIICCSEIREFTYDWHLDHMKISHERNALHGKLMSLSKAIC